MAEHDRTPHFADVDGQPWCTCACDACLAPATEPGAGRECICPGCHCSDTRKNAATKDGA